MSAVYIAFGANLSNPKTTFSKAFDWLGQRGVKIEAVSGLWESPSWPPGQGHPDYVNGAAKIRYDGSPQALLELLMACEAAFGRLRSEKNAPRTLDLDIIDFGGKIIKSPALTLPHPRAIDRPFVLLPLRQAAPSWRDPKTGLHIDDLIARLPLTDMEAINYIGAFAA